MINESTDWNPDQYLKYADHRLRPGIELLDRVPLNSPDLVFDLGCGNGHLTRLLAERWKSATIIGIDRSTEMLSKARAEAGRVTWIEADIRNWRPADSPDLIYSNAALHWIEDHQTLFPRLAGFLKPGGCIAVQMPLSWGLPSHRLMRETLERGGPGGRSFGSDGLRMSVSRKWVGEAEMYYDVLSSLASHLDIWETEYLQVLDGEDPVLAWVRGTGLRPILAGLGEEELELFLSEYRRQLASAYPVRPDGRTIYPFRRLFIVARV